MYDNLMDYNRLDQLVGLEDRILYFLLSEKNKSPRELELVHRIWRILYYNDVDALIDDEKHPLPKYKDIVKLISADNSHQADKRIFRSPRVEEAWTDECSMIKIYPDTIIPKNHLLSVVNVGIEVICNTKIINLAVPDECENVWVDEIDGEPLTIMTMSRVTALTQAIISLLNGAQIQGVGKVIFSAQHSIYNKAQYALWNNRNFEGIKLVMGISMGSVS